MKLFKGSKVKRMLLLVVAGVVFLGLLFLIILPASLGVIKGYDAATIRNKISKQSQCITVESIETNINSETIVDDIKSKKLNTMFALRLSNCDYVTLEDFKSNILNILIDNKVCEDRSIQFFVADFKGEEASFSIDNCSINNN